MNRQKMFKSGLPTGIPTHTRIFKHSVCRYETKIIFGNLNYKKIHFKLYGWDFSNILYWFDFKLIEKKSSQWRDLTWATLTRCLPSSQGELTELWAFGGMAGHCTGFNFSSACEIENYEYANTYWWIKPFLKQ